jgi:Family of unknown function (DUF6098)
MPNRKDDQARRVIGSLAELADLIRSCDDDRQLYARWTNDMDRDERTQVSRDELTGIELPGLSANSLAVEPWWGDRELTTWLARRLYDYRHLREIRGPGTRPWVVTGVETGRGPDNEPLVTQCTAVAEIGLSVIDEAAVEVERFAADWGSLRRA